MKNTIVLLTGLAILSGATLSSCNSPRQKVENAEENVDDANLKLEEANRAYLEDVELYRVETADRIAANEKSIGEFNSRIAKEKKEARADYQKKIDDLNAKNTDLKKTMDDYEANGKEGWEAFKINFNRSMDELSEGIKNVFTPEKK